MVSGEIVVKSREAIFFVYAAGCVLCIFLMLAMFFVKNIYIF